MGRANERTDNELSDCCGIDCLNTSPGRRSVTSPLLENTRSTTVVSVGGQTIGLVGVQEVFEELFASGARSDSIRGELIVRRVAGENYIPGSSEGDYLAALLVEFASFCAMKGAGNQERKIRPDPKPWMGIPREQIPWYPTVDLDHCTGCRDCLSFCPNSVYEWDENRKKVVVSSPFSCEVGCSSCADLCKTKAIAFPPHALLATIREQYGRR